MWEGGEGAARAVEARAGLGLSFGWRLKEKRARLGWAGSERYRGEGVSMAVSSPTEAAQ